ncbi:MULTISPECIES: helix-turn-helix domain-containing protein [unclassified Microbacterium]|uniref:helix-turn-helix domain-containing protein n=1 Tax=unclassified Microbacterium TaxID=2609290 RepID=UPI003016C644
MSGLLNAVTPVRLNLPDPLPLTLTVPAAADLAGIGKNTMWDAVNAGEVPSIRLRGRVLIPTVRFLELFGVEVTE